MKYYYIDHPFGLLKKNKRVVLYIKKDNRIVKKI